MTLEELRYHCWEPISVTLDHELVSKYGTTDYCVPPEALLNLECKRIVDTLLDCSDQVLLANSSLEINCTIPVGTMVEIDTRISDLRIFKGQAFVTV